MSNLMYLARGGLSAAQSALGIIGNNLVNSTTPGYNRRNIMLGENGGNATNNGFFGYGVRTDGVERTYDAFVNNQLRGAWSNYSENDVRYQSLSTIDNLFSDVTNNISTSLDDLFDQMQKVIDDPTNGPARTNVLAQFRALANQFNIQGRALDDQLKSNTTNISGSIDEINNATSSLAKLNKEIARITAESGTAPADLLDKRDSLLESLSKQVNINVDELPNGVVNVTLSNGAQLVDSSDSYKLSTQQDPTDPNKLTLACEDVTGQNITLDDTAITGGKLAGYLKFRNHDLPDIRDQLNQIALQMANKFNQVNESGRDIHGDDGKPIFGFNLPNAMRNSNNQGDASLNVNYGDISQVQARDYTIRFNNGNWEVTADDGSKVNASFNNGKLEFDGLSIDVSGTARQGDSFQLNPTSGIASSLSVALDNGDGIAAAGKSGNFGEGDNTNIKEMFNIKTDKLVNGSTLSDAYGSLVSGVGSMTSQAQGDKDRDSDLVNTYGQQQQSLVGVDMNEEFINLQMYQQYYQANAQILTTANTIFDSILNAVG